jgi:hypothetical protein
MIFTVRILGESNSFYGLNNQQAATPGLQLVAVRVL